MDSSVRRGQTTKGVWMAGHKKNKILIFDCEGTDSKSRSEEDRGKFEHSSSLFSLAMSDVLIINMWTSDVGRYTASNYGVLKIVFEMNLKLFQQNYAKKILIILRDFDPTRNQKNKIEELILNDIHKIWTEIKIPEKYKGKKPEDFFSFEFITLPHKKYESKKFDLECLELRKRFEEKERDDFIFNNLNDMKNVPADGLPQYINQLWTDILNEKELDIPTQREMLANYRCSEIKQNILKENEEKIRQFQKESSEKEIDDFKAKCLEIKDNIMNEYNKLACNYDDKIYKNIGKQIEDHLSQRFYVSFLNQTKRLIPVVQRMMRKELDKKLNNEDGKNYFEFAEKLKKKYVNNLVSKLKNKKAFENWKVSTEEFNNLFDDIIEKQKKNCLEGKKEEIVKIIKKEDEEGFNSILETYENNNFWEKYNELYCNFFYLKIFPLKIYLKECFNLEKNEIKNYLNEIEDSIYDHIKKNIQGNIKEISQILVDLFKKKFWFDENGSVKNWNRFEEIQIDMNFKKIRNNYINIFDEFKNFSVIKNPSELIEENNNQYDEEIMNGRIKNYVKSMESEPLLKQGEIITMRRKFENGISNLLEDAKRRREGLSIGNMPFWFYGLLLFFGYDDLFRIIKSKMIFPILILIGTYFLLVKLGYDWIVKDVYFGIEEKVQKFNKKISKFFSEKFDSFYT